MSDDPNRADHLNFDHLVNRYYRGLYRFAFSLTRREEEAFDLTQQTFYIWATRGHQLRDATKVKPWLFQTLHREFLSRRRREERFPHVGLDTVGAELPEVKPEVIDRLDAATALRGLAEVDDMYQAPLALFYLEDHSYKEIADILEIPIGTVMSRISRGKAQLLSILVNRTPPPSRKEPNG